MSTSSYITFMPSCAANTWRARQVKVSASDERVDSSPMPLLVYFLFWFFLLLV